MGLLLDFMTNILHIKCLLLLYNHLMLSSAELQCHNEVIGVTHCDVRRGSIEYLNQVKCRHERLELRFLPSMEAELAYLTCKSPSKVQNKSIKWHSEAFDNSCVQLKTLIVIGDYGGKDLYFQQFTNLVKLQRLEISKTQIENLHEDLLKLPQQLEILSLQENKIRLFDVKTFSTCAGLRELDLSDNQISTVPLGLFKNCKQLKRLDLSKNHLKLIQAHIFYGLGSLSELHLSSNKIGSIEEGAFNSRLRIEKLFLRNNSISGLTELVLNLPQLSQVDLSSNKLRFMGSVELAFFRSKNLTLLNLKGNRFFSYSFSKKAFCGPRSVKVLLDGADSHYDKCLPPHEVDCVGHSAKLYITFKPRTSSLQVCEAVTLEASPTILPIPRHTSPQHKSTRGLSTTATSTSSLAQMNNRVTDPDKRVTNADKKAHNECRFKNKDEKEPKTFLEYLGFNDTNIWLGYLIVSLLALLFFVIVLFIVCYLKQKKTIYHLKEQNYYFNMLSSQAPTLDLGLHCRAPSMVSSRSMPVDTSHASSGMPLLRQVQSLEKVREDYVHDTDTDIDSNNLSSSNNCGECSNSTRSFNPNVVT